MSRITDCDYCGDITECFEDEGHGTCCDYCGMEHGIKPLVCAEDVEDEEDEEDEEDWEYEHDGQPDEAQEWYDFDPDC